MMRDVFFTRDPLTGRRKPTGVFWAVLVGLIIVAAMGGAVVYAQKTRPAFPTPNPTVFPPASTATQTPLPTSTPTATATWTPVPTEDARALQVREVLQRIEGCERDPALWKLEELPNTYKAWYRIVEPPCVVDGLGRAVAWYMLVYAGGYTFEEAAQALGLERFPVLYAAKGTQWPFKTPKGVWQAANANIIYYPGIREWLTDENGEVRLPIFIPKGCYYARHLQGGIWRNWQDWYGAPFEFQCYLVADEWRHTIVVQKDGEDAVAFDLSTTDVATRIRHTYVFAYDRERGWYLLGAYITDDRFSYTPEELGISSWPLTTDHQEVARLWGREDVIWDAQWLADTWGLEPQPLPTAQTVYTGDEAKQAWRALWNPLVDYFENEWPEREMYIWAFHDPPQH